MHAGLADPTSGAKRNMNYVFLAAAIISEVIGTTFMKESEGFTKLVPAIISAAAYGIAFFCLSQTLKTIPTGIAYAIWSGAGIVLIASVAAVFQGQKLDAPAMIGMGLIICGVVVMNVFSKATGH